MSNSILEKRGVNFYGYESVDSSEKHHYHPAVIRGCGDLCLSKKEIYFKQWITKKECFIPLDKVTKLEIRAWHNLKLKWPGKVLRIHFKEGNGTKIAGFGLGGKLSLSRGWQDDAHKWKEEIESLRQ
jgi:hypothetical protein